MCGKPLGRTVGFGENNRVEGYVRCSSVPNKGRLWFIRRQCFGELIGQVYFTRGLRGFAVILSILSIPEHLSCIRGCAILISTSWPVRGPYERRPAIK